jgi:N-acetylneuraminic acid mutarotase
MTLLVLALLSAVPANVFAQGWDEIGSFVPARTGHTATLLANGHVLVAGGSGAADAQILDPASATGAASTMTAPRRGHTATTLSNGKILVTGGTNDAGPFTSAEIYDPAMNSWSAAEPMDTARTGHTATLLADGTVLVTGGCNTDTGDPVSSAEIYDPAGDSWSPAGSLNETRCFHTATLLPDGRVLAVGGLGSDSASAEIYDPAADSWSPVESMGVGREAHTATLLSNGRVLVAGGFSASAEIYDPATDSWSPAGTMSASRQQHTATLLANGQVLIAGGGTNNNDPLDSSEIYDPATNNWVANFLMEHARIAHTATFLPDGRVLAAGGEIGATSSTAEIFIPPGEPGEADIIVSPASLDFGSVPPGKSAQLILTVQNVGTENLVLGAVTIGGANLTEFSRTSDKCSKKTLLPGASCTVAVRFKPKTDGAKTGAFIIPSTDPDENPVIVPLIGAGGTAPGQPEVTVTPSALDFKNVRTGQSVQKTVTVKNVGSANLSVGAISIVGANGGGFVFGSDQCSNATLGPKKSCKTTVRFTPGSPGEKSATLSIPSDDADENPVDVSLIGTGT